MSYAAHSPLARPSRRFGLPLGLLAGLLLSACATPPSGSSSAAYQAAIADAAVASPAKVAPLWPIPAGGDVKVLAWMSDSRVPCSDGAQQCQFTVSKNWMWVTLVPEVKQACSSWQLGATALRERLEQLLGLPPDSPAKYQKTTFVTMQVPAASLRRPCVGLDNADPSHPRCSISEGSGQSDEVVNFVGRQMVASYVTDNPQGPGYPFTRLGYTFDWAKRNTATARYGASEFIVVPGTAVQVLQQQPTASYCGAAS
ncbi:hypothetical protein OL229_05980 [Neisseriaceae bacterium JH1-16]|nr:hypothetical protein [Neisseriaceae bacterium JH1-16]